MNLQAVNVGMNKYCGPAVLSILTGKSTDECARVISSINGKYTVEGVELRHLIEAANRLGFDCESVSPAATLFGTLIKLAPYDGVYIVTVTGHFVAIEVKDRKIYFCDNHTKVPMPAAASARLQQQCKFVHRVIKRREPIQLTSKTIARKSVTSSGIRIDIITEIRYDIEKYNKSFPVASLKFNTEDDYKDFVKELTK